MKNVKGEPVKSEKSGTEYFADLMASFEDNHPFVKQETAYENLKPVARMQDDTSYDTKLPLDHVKNTYYDTKPPLDPVNNTYYDTKPPLDPVTSDPYADFKRGYFDKRQALPPPNHDVPPPPYPPYPPRSPRPSLGMSRFLTSPRVHETTPSRALIPQDQRPTDQSKLSKLRENATGALQNNFDLVPLDDSAEQILNNYNLHMRVREFARRLQQYDMKDVFAIMQFSDPSSSVPLPTTIDLLEQWDSIDMSLLERHIKFLSSYGQDYDLQNMTWTLELLESSCAQGLADKIQEDLLDVDSSLECGPMFFFLMMRRIISSTEDAVTAMTEKIKSMKVTSFDGEDISQVTGQLKMAIKRLDVLKKIPEDLEKNIISILQTTSSLEFNSYFKQLGVSLKQIPSFKMSYDELLSSANTQYREMVQIGTWKVASPPPSGSTFPAIDAGDALLVGSPPGHGVKLCQRCNKSHAGQCTVPHWKRVPPVPGAPTTKTVNDKPYFWCTRCNGWNLTHLTPDHQTRAEVAAAAAANLASDPIDDDSVVTGAGSAHFASYQMRHLRRGRTPTTFASTVHGGLSRAGR